MDKGTLETYLKTVGMRHDNLMVFWADLMNETKGQIAGWLDENGYKDMRQLEQYLRLNQIVAIGEEIDNENKTFCECCGRHDCTDVEWREYAEEYECEGCYRKWQEEQGWDVQSI